MDLIVMAIRDRALDSYGTPFFVTAVGQGVRGFTDEINKKAEGNMLNAHPEDFDLFVLGSYDTSSGLFKTDVPRQVAVGSIS